MGPTASGKSALAEELAESLGANLISADAFQVYRKLDIGTAKPTNRDRYSLIDICDPDEVFGVGRYVVLAASALKEAYDSGRHVIVVGGTGLYIRALIEEFTDLALEPPTGLREQLTQELQKDGIEQLFERLSKLDPDAAARIDRQNPRRVVRALERAESPIDSRVEFKVPPFKKLKIGIQVNTDTLDRSIHDRLSAMMQGGFIEEVEKLRAGGLTLAAPSMYAIGYRTIYRMLDGAISGDEARQSIEMETRQYAKRQRTWLRSEPKLEWIELESLGERVQAVLGRMN